MRQSTNLRLIAGLERATEGVVWNGARVVHELAPGTAKWPWCSQDYALYPHLSVYGNILSALRRGSPPPPATATTTTTTTTNRRALSVAAVQV